MKKFRQLQWQPGGAALCPFVIISIYLVLTRWPSPRFTAFSDFAAGAVSLLVGAVFVATLPIRPRQRTLSLLVYIPTIALLIFFYTFSFIATVFHDVP